MKKLSLTKTTQIFEIVASICVVASLIWVAIELKLNTEEIQHSNAFEITRLGVENRLRLIETGIAEVEVKARAGETLTAVEQREMSYYHHYLFQMFELAHYQYVEDRLDTQIWESWKRRLAYTLSREPGISGWESSKGIYSERFRDFVEEFQQTNESP